MKTLNPKTEQTKYIWMDGEFVINFQVGECAEQYKIYHGGVVIRV